MRKIFILGCSTAGMLAALRLAHEGIETTILERSDMQSPSDRRTIALTNKSKKILNKIGLWQRFEEYLGEIKDVYVVDSKSPHMLHLNGNIESATDQGHQAAGYMIENRYLKSILLSEIKNNPLINLHTDVDFDDNFSETDEKISLNISNSNFSQGDNSDNLYILCDSKSKLRHEYFKNKVSKDYNQSAITFLVKHEKPHEGTAVEHFMPQGPFASLPMKDQRESGIVWTEKTEVAKLYMQMTRPELGEYLAQRFGNFLGKVEIISDPQVFPLSARITSKYYHKNIVVAGDAAHVIHPLAGQGLNQRIKDIDALGEIIARNLSVGLDVDEFALKEYENKRGMDNYRMYLVTDNLNRFFSNNLPVWRDIRKLGIAFVDKIPFIKKALVGYTGL